MRRDDPRHPLYRPPIPADIHDSPALKKLAEQERSKTMSGESNAQKMRARIKELEAENQRLREEAGTDPDEYETYTPPSDEHVQAAQQVHDATVGAGLGDFQPDPDEAIRVGREVARTGTREDGIVATFRTLVDQAAQRGDPGIKRKD